MPIEAEPNPYRLMLSGFTARLRCEECEGVWEGDFNEQHLADCPDCGSTNMVRLMEPDPQDDYGNHGSPDEW